MTPRSLCDMLLLAALWGASFLFMRISVPEFGPAPMALLRVVGGAAFLLPILLWRGQWPALRERWLAIGFVGITNSAIPFLCYGFAALTISAGLASVFNAATPLFGALFAWAWLGERLNRWRTLGLLIGMAGVLGLAWNRIGIHAGADSFRVALAIAACLLATVLYGFSLAYTKRRLAGLPAMALAAGSQLGAAVALLLPGVLTWPSALPGVRAWLSLLALALLCSGLAYILYFRLIANLGATNAGAVTFLIPVFAMAWGGIFLDEAISLAMVLGCATILVGTALVMGLWPRLAQTRCGTGEHNDRQVKSLGESGR